MKKKDIKNCKDLLEKSRKVREFQKARKERKKHINVY